MTPFSNQISNSSVVMRAPECYTSTAFFANTRGFSDNPYVILLLLNVMLIVAGMLLDAISIYYVFVPIFLPLMKQFGWDPVWFGVMMTVNLAIGTITPPVAVNLYVASRIYVPALSLWLPDALGIR